MTVGLVMIVRDEEHVIGRCLRSVIPHVDYWTICDTGSTDATEQIARSFLGNTPGQWCDDEWVDFGHNRSLALERARGTADYLLLMDADMELRATAALFDLGAEAYDIAIDDGTAFHYRLPALIRGDIAWRSDGATHECLSGGNYPLAPADPLSDWWLVHHLDGSRRPRKDVEDIALLEQSLADEPGDARAVFYLAQTLQNLGRWHEAIGMYQRRLALGGWHEELFWARYQLGCLLATHVSFDEGADHLLRAWRMNPDRIEPLRALANAANNVADKAEPPSHGLFVHLDQYRKAA